MTYCNVILKQKKNKIGGILLELLFYLLKANSKYNNINKNGKNRKKRENN
jgi:hypothetical protein